METGTFLERLGFAHSQIGFECTEKAIDALIGGYNGKMMVLYYEVGQQIGKKWTSTERAIRHAISCAMDRNPNFFRELGLPEARWGSKFTNSEFLYTAAYRLKKIRESEGRKEDVKL